MNYEKINNWFIFNGNNHPNLCSRPHTTSRMTDETLERRKQFIPEAEAIPVEQLQMKVSDFNVKELDIYSDEYDLYDVYFIIPEGKVLASYDKENNLLRTVERYKNINLPLPVMESITKRFPNWSVSKNIYLVNYHESGNMRKLYKLTLENGDQRIKVKADDRGIFL